MTNGPARKGPGERRRILLLTPRLLDSSDGRCTTNLALALDREHFEPLVCCYAGWGPLAEELRRAGIDIFPFRRRSGLDPTFMPALAAEIRARGVDVVHALHARTAYVMGALSGVLAGAAPIVGTFRDAPPRSSFERVRRVLPRAQLVVCGSERDEADPTGLGPYADSPAFYAAIDVLCIPFARRVVPLTLLEGLAAGVPIAASRRPSDFGLAPAGPWAFADITEPGSAALARGLCELILEGESAAALVRGGRKCVQEEHAFEPYVRAMEAIYRG